MAEYFMNKWDTYYEYLDTIPPISFCGSKEQWFAILEEEQKKLREKREKMKTEKKKLRKDWSHVYEGTGKRTIDFAKERTEFIDKRTRYRPSNEIPTIRRNR